MKTTAILVFIFILNIFNCEAQIVEVPNNLRCVGIELHFSEALRKELQTEVDALVRNQKYFNSKLQRAIQYFPVIERIFNEEKIPLDIKYLAIQESALIPDAVSSSNAVGYWQFKEIAAREVGLQVDNNVDERMNIVSSTRGAAKYLKTNYLFFNNWIYAILSYNTGRGGADPYIQKKYFGARKMELDKDLHWYVKKFLAHMIAFSQPPPVTQSFPVVLNEYTEGTGKSLSQISNDLGILPDDLISYNKWLKSNRIPTDKTYVVIVPAQVSENKIVTAADENETVDEISPNMLKYPIIKRLKEGSSRKILINGIPGIIGQSNESIQAVSSIGGISIKQFLINNDLSKDHKIFDGQVYYFKTKHLKAREYFHTVLKGETLWSISQKYGIKLKVLISKNRLNKENQIQPGLVLWIRYIKPANEPVKYVKIPEIIAYPGFNTDLKGNGKVNQLDTMPDTKNKVQEKNLKVYSDVSLKNETSEEITPSKSSFDSTGNVTGIQPDTMIVKSALFHIVEKGETLFSISKKYNIPLMKLMDLNDIKEGENIQIGQQIFLKESDCDIKLNLDIGKNDTESYIYYEVLKGDTMYSISKKFNVSIGDLQKWNDMSSIELKLGQKIKVLKRRN